MILQDQPDRGSESLFDKFERHAPRERDLAVALLTADDLARAKNDPDPDLAPRARQNVILELGYCYATIGRERVWVLLDGGVERPSDIAGGMWMPTSDQWTIRLRDNIRAALDEDE